MTTRSHAGAGRPLPIRTEWLDKRLEILQGHPRQEEGQYARPAGKLDTAKLACCLVDLDQDNLRPVISKLEFDLVARRQVIE